MKRSPALIKKFVVGLLAAVVVALSGCAPAAEEEKPQENGRSSMLESSPAPSSAPSQPQPGSSAAESETASSSSDSDDSVKQAVEVVPFEEAEQLSSGIQSISDAVLLNVPCLYQLPELPTGCEITAMTMVLQYFGYQVGKEVMASTYLPQSDSWYYEGGLLYGPDSRVMFAGDPFDAESGIVCGAQAIVTAANGYLTEIGSSERAIDLTGDSPEELYDLLQKGLPSAVWVTIDMVDRVVAGGWYAAGSGDYLDWSASDHCAVLTGVDNEYVYLNDPLSGKLSYPRVVFEDIFYQRGMQAVTLS